MLRTFYEHYWQVGFKTRLYDLLAPEAYIDSLRQSTESIPVPVERLLDAGCGSGLGFPFLKNKIAPGGCFVGLDILDEGLRKLQAMSVASNVSGKIFPVKADLSRNCPLKPESFDAVVAHFSVYTLGSEANRILAWKEIFRVMKPGAMLIASNPSDQFVPRNIIAFSLDLLKHNKGRDSLGHRFLIYPVTRILGLNHIERQLKTGIWKAYSELEFKNEIADAGFEVSSIKPVYAGSGYLLTAIRK